MKKIFMIILFNILFLFGCKSNKAVEVNDIIDYIDGLSSYSLEAEMLIKKESKNISMKICVDYLKPDNYKVVFGEENEQIILKNSQGVYVITPELNKEFKFDSSWPNNSSHAYLLNCIGGDLKKDNNSKIINNDNELILEGKVFHKTNNKICKMKYICNKKYTPIKTIFLDEDDNELIEVLFTSFKENPSFSKDHFSDKKYLNKDVVMSEEEDIGVVLETAYTLEGNVLSVSKSFDGINILCYTGEKPYTIVVNKVKIYSETIALEEFCDVILLNDGLGLLKENSLTYFIDDYQVTIYSNSLNINDYIEIASNISLI